jgi:mono/diheme cytochrome c family protein
MRAAITAVLVSLAGIVFVAALMWYRSQSAIGYRYTVAPEPPLAVAGASVERGKHLASAVGGCEQCHGAGLGGLQFLNKPGLMVVYAPNLTRGKNGAAATWSDADFERAIRHGIRPDGTPLVIMPSWDSAPLSDADTAALIAYIRSVPPVDTAPQPAPAYGPFGRALISSNQLSFDAAKIASEGVKPADPPAPPALAAGAYLARISGCESCHGVNLRGGLVPGDPSAPVAPNVISATEKWSQADFDRLMRTGVTPNLYQVKPPMPWPVYKNMTPDELRSLYAYINSLRS